jgi:hypothetical protein
VVSAPIGSAPIAELRLLDEPASSRPNSSRKIGAMEEAKVVQPITPAPEERRGRYRE